LPSPIARLNITYNKKLNIETANSTFQTNPSMQSSKCRSC